MPDHLTDPAVSGADADGQASSAAPSRTDRSGPEAAGDEPSAGTGGQSLVPDSKTDQLAAVPSPAGAPLWVVLCAVAAVLATGLTAVLMSGRVACALLAACLVAGGVARATLPERTPRPSALRSRAFDVTLMIVAGMAMAILVAIAPGV